MLPRSCLAFAPKSCPSDCIAAGYLAIARDRGPRPREMRGEEMAIDLDEALKALPLIAILRGVAPQEAPAVARCARRRRLPHDRGTAELA